jgi:hypothetical protein
MASITSKYFVLTPAGDNLNFLDFDLSYGTINMIGQEIAYIGSSRVDAIFVSPGLTYDLTGTSGGGADKIYLTGSLSDYTLSLFGTSNQNLKLTGVFNGLSETVIVPGGTALNYESLIFANGTVNSNALYNSFKNTTTAPTPTGETSLAPTAPSAAAPGATLDATIKAFSLNPAAVGQEGETFATTKPGIKFIVSGGNGIDTVYVADGANVTFTSTGASVDMIYMRGSWSDYTKEFLANNTQIKFTRTLGDGTLESVIVSAGTSVNYDRVIFRDGNISTIDAKTALVDVTKGLDATVPELGAAFNTGVVTPGLNPYITGAVEPALNTAKSGDTLNITVNFDQAVVLAEGKTVTLTATIDTPTGTQDITLTATGGAGGTTGTSLHFLSAALPAGLNDANGISIKASSLALGTASAADFIGANALAVATTNPELTLVNQLVDSVAPADPTITGVLDVHVVGSNAYYIGTTPTLYGTAEAGAIVTLDFGGGLTATTIASAAGDWSYTTSALADGVYPPFSITATDAAGNVSAVVTGTLPLVLTAALPFVLADLTVAAADLLALDAALVSLTGPVVDANAATLITGSQSEILTLISSPRILVSGSFDVTVNTGSVSVANANLIAAATSGVVTAVILETDAATLKTLAGTGNAYTITVADDPVSAADLNAIDAVTTVTVTATAASTITGSVSDFATMIAAGPTKIATAVDYAATVTGSASIAELAAIDAANGTGAVTYSSVTDSAANLTAVGAAAYLAGKDVIVNDAATIAELTIIDGFKTTGTLSYLAISDNALNLAIDAATNSGAGTYVTDGINVTVTDGATIEQLAIIDSANGTGVLTYNTVSDTAANLVTNTGNYVTAAINVNVSNAATIAELTAIDVLSTGTLTATAITDASTAIVSAGVASAYILSTTVVTVSNASVAASDLTLIDMATTVAVNADAVTEITGTATEIDAVATAIGNGDITVTNFNAAPTTSATVAEANNIDSNNGSGIITAIISDRDAATLKTLTGSGNAYSITVADTTVEAADLSTIDAATTEVVNANAVTEITGTAAEVDAVATAIGNGAITVSSFDAAPTTSLTVAQANNIDLINGSGIITATIVDTDAATLKTLTGTGNAYTITVADTTVEAADLNTIDAATTVAIEATAATTITGTAAEIITAGASAGITMAVDYAATVNSGTATVTQANAIDADNGSGIITAIISDTDATTLATLTDVQFANLLAGASTLAANDSVVLNDTGAAYILDDSFGNGTLTVGGTANGAYTIDMGTSSITTIHLAGTGNHNITSAAGIETFILDAAQNGGSTLNNLTAGDVLNIDGAGAIADLITDAGSALDVDMAGEYFIGGGAVTYFNDAAGSAQSILYTTTGTLQLQSADTFIIV